ncbi:MAG: hypothetical protein GYB53_10510, partial [Rhodobacteraceae bacterium]|nr:hypothetical protein [Paracoccaceae bacterium]MBR9822276.1 hypothetical protein [Paracoccaceae bacterium]
MTDFSTMTVDEFTALQGSACTVASVQPQIELTLIEVQRLSSGLREGGAVSLLWQGPGEPALPQATYALTHETHGAQELFLVPVARVDAGYQYEAIFT